MKLRNKKTGEIVEATDFNIISEYNSLAELNEDWEDYEEPKDFWYIDVECGVMCDSTDPGLQDKRYPMEFMKSIGNYFETREEAEKAVEKLKAWKRLKDKGFKFEWWLSEPSSDHIEFYMDSFEWDKEATKDLNLLFESGDLEAKNE